MSYQNQYGHPPPQNYGYGQPPQNFGYGQPGAPGGYGGGAYGQPTAPPGLDPQVHQWFLSVDHDKSGKINMHELQQALTNANWTHFNAETCRLMIGMFDKDQSGQIEMNEFQALWNYIIQWKSVFEQFDRDRSGFIDANELCNALNTMGYKVTPQFANHVVFRYDPQAKQRLGLDNFIQVCVLIKSVTDMFRQRDSQMKGTIQVAYEDFMTMVMLNKP
ncbi:hypothetical protein HELRODRAFT_116724 [Helobdella robusta]|uniref:EF-hand domain-containing protein n=1 Tax=Helobdella robusta TaxID=6412 RepID=T1EGH2_HELRO|nr:hypothetical protein HELRODRAFT_116724 [Helobdella robusta]ESN89929.1 hypothetical protein HELRODRAFT_116724 [Helobdella robusta]